MYYDKFIPLGSKRRKALLDRLSLEQLRGTAVSFDLGGPFEDTPRRLTNHIMARLALSRSENRPPPPGTLLLGVHREPAELALRILDRTKHMYTALVDEWSQIGSTTAGFVPPDVIETIGYGDFWPHINEGLHPSESIYWRTRAYAEWQTKQTKRWMPHVQWVGSTDEAVERYREHVAVNG